MPVSISMISHHRIREELTFIKMTLCQSSSNIRETRHGSDLKQDEYGVRKHLGVFFKDSDLDIAQL